MSGGRITVGVSGAGSNLRALQAAAERGELGGEIVLVFADRACPALDWAVEQGIETALVPGGDDDTLAETLAGARPDVVALAGYMRILGPSVLAAYDGRTLNTHPSLLPAFPGIRAIEQALAYGAKVFGVTVHYVEPGEVDSGPVILQGAVEAPGAREPADVLAAIRPLEHALLPRAVALIAAGAVRRDPDHPRRVVVDAPG